MPRLKARLEEVSDSFFFCFWPFCFCFVQFCGVVGISVEFLRDGRGEKKAAVIMYSYMIWKAKERSVFFSLLILMGRGGGERHEYGKSNLRSKLTRTTTTRNSRIHNSYPRKADLIDRATFINHVFRSFLATYELHPFAFRGGGIS